MLFLIALGSFTEEFALVCQIKCCSFADLESLEESGVELAGIELGLNVFILQFLFLDGFLDRNRWLAGLLQPNVALLLI